MPVWIVDDGPLDTLAMVVDPTVVASWPASQFKVADATRREATGNRRTLLNVSPSPFSVFSVLMGSNAADVLYKHLRQPSASDKNLAEHQSVAWALSQCPEAVLVARDKRAAFLALAELGRGGAAHPSELWLHLLDEGLITEAQFQNLCARTSQGEQCPIPLRCQSRSPGAKRKTMLKQITDDLVADLAGLTFGPPVTHVYNPLVYARAAWDAYCEKYGQGRREVLMIGMNPGPWRMSNANEAPRRPGSR
jgi:hypothetical protein